MARFLALLVLVGCASAAHRPHLKVIGSVERRLLVEIHNPTDYTIDVASFDWTLVSSGHAVAAGTQKLRRAVLPGGSAVIELAVPVRPSGDYRLDGRLHAKDRASWQVSVTGRFQ